MSDIPESQEKDIPQTVECRAAMDPAIRVFIVTIGLIAVGVWSYAERAKYQAPEAWDVKHINEAAGYAMNHFGPYVCIPAGLIIGAMGIAFVRRRLIADEKGIGYAGKERITWDSISKIDSEKLKSKGIMYLRYGEGKSLKLDSWKLTNFRSLVTLIESKVSQDS